MDVFDHLFLSPTDFDRSLNFYTSVLGWEVTSQWGDAASGRGATLQRGQVQIAMAERHRDALPDASDRAINGTRPTIYIAVDDLQARYRGMSDPSSVVIPPERTHWGIEWFVVRDPDGNLVAFTQKN